MKKRKLGNTDIYLSAIGFGGAPIGNLFEKLDDETCYKTLECCNDFNINLYDTLNQNNSIFNYYYIVF